MTTAPHPPAAMSLPSEQPVIEPVAWEDPLAVAPRAAMDEEIAPRYADLLAADPGRYTRRARILEIDPADIAATFIASVGGVPVGHAALRRLGHEWELKRVITLPSHRGRGVSRALIARVEEAAFIRGATRLILQTGNRQPEAIRLYEHLGYLPIPVYPPYDAILVSLCYARNLP